MSGGRNESVLAKEYVVKNMSCPNVVYCVHFPACAFTTECNVIEQSISFTIYSFHNNMAMVYHIHIEFWTLECEHPRYYCEN